MPSTKNRVTAARIEIPSPTDLQEHGEQPLRQQPDKPSHGRKIVHHHDGHERHISPDTWNRYDQDEIYPSISE